MGSGKVCGARRARRHSRAERVGSEAVVQLAGVLDEPERRLVVQVYGHGVPLAGIAAVAGTRPAVLQRRLRKIRKRMQTPEFRVVSECLELFPPKYRAVARRRFLCGDSLERTATETGLTVHQVRQRLCAVDALIKVGRQLMAADAVAALDTPARPDDDPFDGLPQPTADPVTPVAALNGD